MGKALFYFSLAIFGLLLIGIIYIQNLPAGDGVKLQTGSIDISQNPYYEISLAKILEASDPETVLSRHYSSFTQELKVRLLSGSEKNKEVTATYADQLINEKEQIIKTGQIIVVGKIKGPIESEYVFVDRFRLVALGILAFLFFLMVIIFGRLRGISSIAGLVSGIIILLGFIVPNILAGKSPLLITLVGGGLIAVISMYLSHGFRQRTALAFTSLFLVLILAEILAYLFVKSAMLLGSGSQEAYFLQIGFLGNLNLQGLFLSGILIGTLGVLDDVTATQAAAVEEIHKADPLLGFKELFIKGTSVGKEHIASLVNTLVMAYVGASLPMFILISLQSQTQMWVLLNSEFLAEEIVRTLVGSMALVLAVPISTLLAAYYFSLNKSKNQLPN